MNRGFSIIEILIAMAIAIIVISGVVSASGGFGSTLRGYQSTIMNGQTNAEAVAKAQQVLEQAQSLGRQDFNLVNPTATTSIDGFYYKSVDVQLQPDFLTKLVTTTISWFTDHNATTTTRMSTLVTNLENPNSPNTCNSTLSGDWTNPQISAPINVEDPANSASGNPVTNIDVLNQRLYIATDNSHGNNADFYIFDSSVDPQNPTYLGSVKTITKKAGLSAVAVSSTTAAKYAYVASAYDPNFQTCVPGPNCSQLQVIDVGIPATPTVVNNFEIATNTESYVLGNTGGAGSGQAAGKSIFYKDGLLYLGLTTTSNGPGFHIIDVGNGIKGGTPLAPKWVSSWPDNSSNTLGASGAPINSIYVRGKYAYLAHPTGLIGVSGPLNEQITVLDVSNPLSPQRRSFFFDNGGIGGNGRSIYSVGNILYFGRTQTSNSHPELFILDNSDPTQLSTNNPSPYGRRISESVNGFIVRSNIAFVTSNTAVQILDISNPAIFNTETPVKSWTLASLGGLGPGSTGNASNCEGNNVYIGSYRSNNDKGVFLVIYPGIPFDYSLSNGGGVTVTQGASGSAAITSSFISGTPSAVTYGTSGLPAGATPSFTTACTPTCSSTLTITTLASTPVGIYPVMITGSPSGTSNPSTTFNLVVNPQAFAYTMTPSPTTKSISQGTSYQETIDITKTAGTAQPVSVSLSGFQNNVSASPANATCTPNPTCSVAFTISAASNGQKVTRTITATGVSPANTATFTLTITN